MDHATLQLAALAQHSTDPRLKKLFDLMRSERVNVEIPGFHPPKLPEYQKKGIVAPFIQPRFLIGDDVGLGKTAEGLGFLCLLKARQRASTPYLIITPSPSLSQWASEVRRFTDLSYTVIRGAKQERMSQYQEAYGTDLALVAYETFRFDFERVPWFRPSTVLLDEATAFKNHETKTFAAVKAVTADSHYVVGMSATPLQNALDELWSVFHIIDPSIFGPRAEFRNLYCNVKELKVRIRGSWKKSIDKVVGYRNLAEVSRLIAPYYLRRVRENIPDHDKLKLPKAYQQDRWLDLTERQQEVYDEIVSAKGINPAQKRIRALQVCDTLRNFPDRGDDSPKIEEITNLLSGELKGSKVVIFSCRKLVLYQLYEWFEREGVGWADLTGDVDIASGEREANRLRFWNDPDCLVAVITTSGEVAINLQCAKAMIQINQLYNPKRMKQLTGRVDRSESQHDEIFVIRLLHRNTVEEKVLRVLEEKESLFSDLFGNEEVFAHLSELELEQLL